MADVMRGRLLDGAVEARWPAASGIDVTDNPVDRYVESVFLIGRQALERGDYRDGVPVILVDRGLSHRYGEVRLLRLVDPPELKMAGRGPDGATPVCVISAREAMLYPNAQLATVVEDCRQALDQARASVESADSTEMTRAS
jgi:hypothetical protein